jgi:hypothetical protein
MSADRFRELWDTLLPIGRDPGGTGWLRPGWSTAELADQTRVSSASDQCGEEQRCYA